MVDATPSTYHCYKLHFKILACVMFKPFHVEGGAHVFLIILSIACESTDEKHLPCQDYTCLLIVCQTRTQVVDDIY